MDVLGSKSEISSTVIQTKFNELLAQCDGSTDIFTDGSEIGEAMVAAI